MIICFSSRKYLIFLTINTVQSLIVGTVDITIGKNLRIEFLDNGFMIGIGCANELVIRYV